MATLTGILNRTLVYAFIFVFEWKVADMEMTLQSTWRSTVVTCSGLLQLLTMMVSGGPSWDSCLHRPFVVSLNIMSFSSKLSCLAIGSTRGLLQETINTTISSLLTVLYQSKAMGGWTTEGVFTQMKTCSISCRKHASFPFISPAIQFHFSKKKIQSFQLQKKMFTEIHLTVIERSIRNLKAVWSSQLN